MSNSWLAYNNIAAIRPINSAGVINPHNLGSTTVAAKAKTKSSAYINLTFPSSSSVRIIELAGLSIRSGGSPAVQFQFSDTLSGGSETLSVTKSIDLKEGYHLQVWVLDTVIKAQYLRIEFTDIDEIGLIWASPAFSQTNKMVLDTSQEFQRSSKGRKLTFGFESTKNELAILREIERMITKKQVLLIPAVPWDVEGTTNILGCMSRISPIFVAKLLEAICYEISESK